MDEESRALEGRLKFGVGRKWRNEQGIEALISPRIFTRYYVFLFFFFLKLHYASFLYNITSF